MQTESIRRPDFQNSPPQTPSELTYLIVPTVEHKLFVRVSPTVTGTGLEEFNYVAATAEMDEGGNLRQ